jgi:hypothetical protein
MRAIPHRDHHFFQREDRAGLLRTQGWRGGDGY